MYCCFLSGVRSFAGFFDSAEAVAISAMNIFFKLFNVFSLRTCREAFSITDLTR